MGTRSTPSRPVAALVLASVVAAAAAGGAFLMRPEARREAASARGGGDIPAARPAAAPGRVSAPAQAPRGVTHPAADSAPQPAPVRPMPTRAPSGPEALEEMRRGAEAAQRYYAAPLSLVAADEKVRIYSRAVNQVVAVARGGAVEWLGTRQGVKRWDRERGTVRVYGRGDGLPGDLVRSVVADAGGGAAALVMTDTGGFAACLYEPVGDRWRVLGEVPAAPGDGWMGRPEAMRFRSDGTDAPKIALTPTRVVLAPPYLNLAKGQELTCWDRASGKVTPLPWDEVLRADHPFLIVADVAALGETVWLGTHIGLLAHRKEKEKDVWRRSLPLLAVYRIVAPELAGGESGGGADAGRVYLAVTPRGGSGGAGDPLQARLVRAALGGASVTTEDLPPPGAGRVPAPAATAAAVADDGALWVARDRSAGFAQFAPAAGRWRFFSEDGTPAAGPPPFPPRGGLMPPYFPGQQVPVAPPGTVPDEVARLMAWVRQRFPQWLSPDAEANEAEKKYLGEVAGAYRPARQFVTDPTDPGTAWGVENGRDGSPALVRLSAGEVPDLRRVPGASMNGRGVSVYAPVTAGKADRFPLRGGAASIPVKVAGVVVAPAALGFPAGTLIAHTSEGLFRVDGAARQGRPRWERIGAAISRPFPFSLDGGKLVRAGDGVFYETFLDPKLLRYDRAGGKFVPSTADRGSAFQGASSAGLWEIAYERVATAGGGWMSRPTNGLRFLPVGGGGRISGEWRTVAVPPSPGAGYRDRGSDSPLALTGTVAWYALRREKTGRERYPNPHGEYPVLVGYDVRREAWTAPLEMPPFENEPPGVAEEAGRTYATFRAPDGCVWRYDHRTGRWESVAPNLPPIAGDNLNQHSRIRLVSAGGATGGEVWVMDNRSLARLDRARKEWVRHPLPEALTDNSINYFALSTAAVAADAGAIYVGGRQGLYRFDRARGAWEETNPTMPLGEGGATFSLRAVAADREAVWALGSLTRTQQGVLVRLDRKTRRARVLTAAEAGLPTAQGLWNGIVFDGDAVWVWNGGEALRRDPATGRFARVASGGAAEVVPDPHDPDSVYVVSGDALLRWSRKAGKVAETVRADSLPEASRPFPRSYAPPRTLASVLPTAKAVYLAGRGALYRRARSGGGWEAVPVPTLFNVRLDPSEAGITASDERTVVLLRE